MQRFFSPKYIITAFFVFFTAIIYLLSSIYCDEKFNDFFIKYSSIIFNRKASDSIVLVSIDDESLKRENWPWKRSLYSDIFDYLEYDSGAKAIIFDNLVLYPDTYNQNSDFNFYENLFSHKKLINSYIFVNSSAYADILPKDYLNIFNDKSNVNITDKRKNKISESYQGILKVPRNFLIGSNILAFSQLPKDKDDCVRSYMPVIQFNGRLYPSLALSTYALYSGIENYYLTDDFLCSDDNCKSLKLPVYSKIIQDYNGHRVNAVLTKIFWYKKLINNGSHKNYSAIDVVDSYNDYHKGIVPKIKPSEFKDKIIVVGLNTEENKWTLEEYTPISKNQSKIDIQAVMIDNFISNRFLSINKNSYSLFITILFTLFILFGFKTLKRNLILALLLSSVYFVYYMCQYIINAYIPPVSPIITIFSVCIFKQIYIFILEDKKAEMIKRALGKYVSNDVMKSVLQNLDKLKLGGTRAEVTILFVDIRNFTELAEENSPADVTSVLNEYFSTIEPVIAKHHGIINKYMGDGALVVFGEPIKMQNHAVNAVLCGMEIMDKVKILKEKFLAEGKPKINIGIGINTGEVFAGNVGTEERLEYTVIGDNVNLAYRIEALNQILKTQFLISEYTYEYVKDNIEVVKLSQMNIKGKSKPIDIYEVLKIK